MISLQNVRKVYGEGETRVEALKGIDLEIARGQFVSIMGPSGSGKSTLLNLVSALDVPTAGRMSSRPCQAAQRSPESFTARVCVVVVRGGAGAFALLAPQHQQLWPTLPGAAAAPLL